MRERGLKHLDGLGRPTPFRSLPVRERGLKPPDRNASWMSPMSLPVRERGLKRRVCSAGAARKDVAPRAGAWIEAHGIVG